MENRYIIPISQIHHHHPTTVGQLASTMSQLYRSGISVAPGFVITKQTIIDYLIQTGLHTSIRPLISDLNLMRHSQIQAASKKIQTLIHREPLPDPIAISLAKAYSSLHSHTVQLYYSLTAKEVSLQGITTEPLLGKYATGDANFIHTVREMLMTWFSADAIAHRHRHNLDHLKVELALLVQATQEAIVSGYTRTLDEIHHQKNLIRIEAVWGLADDLLHGSLDPDIYVVEKRSWRIDQLHTSSQTFQRLPQHPHKRTRVPPTKRNRQKLTHDDIVQLAKEAFLVHQHLYYPQQLHWYKTRSGKLYITRTDAIEQEFSIDDNEYSISQNQPLMTTGQAAFPGIAFGKVQLILNNRDIKSVRPGTILALNQYNPNLLPIIKHSRGLLIEHGSETSVLTHIAHRIHLPTITSIENLSRLIKTNDVITINGSTGQIFAGAPKHITPTKPELNNVITPIKTATKLIVSLGDITHIPDLQSSNIDGVIISLLEEKKLVTAENLLPLIDLIGERGIWTELMWPEHTIENRESVREEHEQLSKQLEVFYSLREKHAQTHLLLPATKPLAAFEDFFRYMHLHHLRHTLPSKLWLPIAFPASALVVDQYLNHHLDGLVLDISTLLWHLHNLKSEKEVGPSLIEHKHAPIRELLIQVLHKATQHHLPVLAKIPQTIPSTLISDLLIKSGVDGVAIDYEAVNETKADIYEKERSFIAREQ